MASRTTKDDPTGTAAATADADQRARAARPAATAPRRVLRVRGPRFTIFSRSVVFAYCVALCLGVTFAYAGTQWLSVLYRLLADGLMLAAWLACAAGLGSAVLLLLLPLGERRPAAGAAAAASRADEDLSLHAADTGGLLYWVTATALGLGLFSLATLILGLLGWLSYPTAVALLATGGLLGLFAFARSDVWRRRATFGDEAAIWLSAPAGWGWLWLAAMPFLGIAIVAALLPPGVLWPGEPLGYDVVSYHLQLPREWYDLGRIAPLKHNVFSYFPLNVEMHYLLAMHLTGGAWAGMYLAHFMHLSMVALTVAAVYGFARGEAPSQANAVIAALAAAVVPWMAQVGSIGYNEGGLLLFGTLAVGWAFRAALDPARRLGRFPVAGLMAGFACGSKLTGVPEVLFAVGALAALSILVSHRASRRLRAAAEAEPRVGGEETGGQGDTETRGPADVGGAREAALPYATPGPLQPKPVVDASVLPEVFPLRTRLAGVAVFFIAGLLAFSPWLVKNQAWAGNPVFPEAASVLGKAHFSDTQVERWRTAHAPTPDQRTLGARFAAWTRQVWGNWQYGYVLIPLGLVAAAAAYDRPGTWMLLGMLVLLSVVWLGFTHLQGRFFILAIPIAALLLARMDWGGAPWAGALVVLLAGGYGYYKLHETVADRLYQQNPANPADYPFVRLLGTELVGDAPRGRDEPPFRNIPNSGPVVAVFVAPMLDEIPGGTPLALVGDVRPYWYAIPMQGLSYRTVFDVDVKPGQSILEAWADGAVPGSMRLVDPEELRRFHRTYAGIPPFPSWYEDRLGPFLLPPPDMPVTPQGQDAVQPSASPPVAPAPQQ